jgi:aminopeptidase N
MRRLLPTLFLATVSMVAFAQPGPGSPSLNDPIFAFMGNGGYDALEYEIALKFSADKASVTGSSTMSARATQDLSSFNLDFGSMTVASVRVNDEPATFEHTDPELAIRPARALVKGQPFRVRVEYAGKPGTGVVRAADFGAWNVGPNGLVALAEPSRMFTWAPVNDHPSDKATFTLHLTAPNADEAIANGTRVSRLENADGTATTTYRIPTPTATYLVVLAVGSWTLEAQPDMGGVRVRNYLAPGTPYRLRTAIAETPAILNFLVDLLGPYPFAEAGTLTHSGDFVGLETQGLIALPMILGEEEAFYNVETIAHEFAHQWFGALVTFKTHQDIFVHEGFAQYLGWLYTGSDSPEYVDQNIRLEYPSFVNGQSTQTFASKDDLLSSLRSDASTVSLGRNQVARVLELIFTTAMPSSVRDALLARVDAEGWSLIHLASELQSLNFSRVVIPTRNIQEIQKLSGANVTLAPSERYRYTPPGKLTPEDNLFNSGVYNRGATAVHALRLRIGNDRFWTLVRGFLDAHRFGNASNLDWLEFVQAKTDATTRAFFEHWLIDDVPPDVPELGLKAADFKIGSDLTP